MATTTLANSQWKLEILPVAGASGPTTDNPTVLDLQTNALKWRRKVKVATLVVVRTAPGSYTWQFTHDDARTWEQTLVLGNELGQCMMTWSVMDAWSLYEVGELYRACRECVLKLLLQFELERVDITWME